jgi:nucleotide-binding universal stress UspA family protein
MKTILVPVDFSTNAINALKYAVQFALQSKSKLILYYAYHVTFMDVSTLSDADFKKSSSDLALEKIKRLQSVFEKVWGDLKIRQKKPEVNFRVESELVASFITKGIMQCVRKYKADMVIMGTHGATGLEKVLLGSNTADVILHSKVPVLSVPRKYRFRKIKTIVYASDFKQPEKELKIILPVAQELKAELELLHLEYNWEKELDANKHFEKILKKFKYNKMHLVHQKMSIEDPMIDYLKKYMAKKTDAILAMFSNERNFLDRLLLINSKVVDMSFKLKRPLLAVRKSVL